MFGLVGLSARNDVDSKAIQIKVQPEFDGCTSRAVVPSATPFPFCDAL